MKVYVIQRKTFYVNELNEDVQIADCGIIPDVYTNRARAEKDFYKEVEERGGNKHQIHLFPYTFWEEKTIFCGKPQRFILTLQETETF